MSVNVVYRASARATGGRDGRSATEDGALDLRLSTPKELGGAGGEGVNPEQLFALGYSACFLGALKAVAAKEKVKIPAEATVNATIGIGARSEGGFGLEAALVVDLPGIERETAEALVEKAHEVCPYSNATRGNVEVSLSLA